MVNYRRRARNVSHVNAFARPSGGGWHSVVMFSRHRVPAKEVYHVPTLFEPLTAGRLAVRNRFMRSATAEIRSDPITGAPGDALADLYRALALGGVGLIVTGHAYVDIGGKAHGCMSSVAEDAVIPIWRTVIRPAQEAGARVMMQINHAGASVDPAVTPNPLSPSGVATNELVRPREMTAAEIERVICAYGQAARRAQEAGFDGVQIHGAHGYLVSQFLMPVTNRREDGWGGDLNGRLRFLREATREIRRQVGAEYPLWIKLGVAGSQQNGFSLYEGATAAAACVEMGIDGVEVSHTWGAPEYLGAMREARYLPLATAVRQAVGPHYPLALVSGLQRRAVMESVIAHRLVQLISLCRPLIAEPDFPNRLERGATDCVACVRCDQCRAGFGREAVTCRNMQVQRELAD